MEYLLLFIFSQKYVILTKTEKNELFCFCVATLRFTNNMTIYKTQTLLPALEWRRWARAKELLILYVKNGQCQRLRTKNEANQIVIRFFMYLFHFFFFHFPLYMVMFAIIGKARFLPPMTSNLTKWNVRIGDMGVQMIFTFPCSCEAEWVFNETMDNNAVCHHLQSCSRWGKWEGKLVQRHCFR